MGIKLARNQTGQQQAMGIHHPPSSTRAGLSFQSDLVGADRNVVVNRVRAGVVRNLAADPHESGLKASGSSLAWRLGGLKYLRIENACDAVACWISIKLEHGCRMISDDFPSLVSGWRNNPNFWLLP